MNFYITVFRTKFKRILRATKILPKHEAIVRKALQENNCTQSSINSSTEQVLKAMYCAYNALAQYVTVVDKRESSEVSEESSDKCKKYELFEKNYTEFWEELSAHIGPDAGSGTMYAYDLFFKLQSKQQKQLAIFTIVRRFIQRINNTDTPPGCTKVTLNAESAAFLLRLLNNCQASNKQEQENLDLIRSQTTEFLTNYIIERFTTTTESDKD